jgi:chemotaxis protein CheD
MYNCDEAAQINLPQGQVIVCDRFKKIHTILGSCISITFYVPEIKLGIMSHVVYPGRFKLPTSKSIKELWYMENAIDSMISEITSRNIPMASVTVKIFGGGFTPSKAKNDYSDTMGNKNIESAKNYLKKNNIRIFREDVGGPYSRSVFFCILTGKVYLKKTETRKLK